MIMRQCIYAFSHLETALQIARQEEALRPLLDPLKHALDEIRGLQEEIVNLRRSQTNVIDLMRIIAHRDG